ncbi:guanine deaminase [Ferdinandcohnia sp. Marseille-Q9671]
MNDYTRIFHGTAFTSHSPKRVEILKDVLFCVNERGIIEKVVRKDDVIYQQIIEQYQHSRVYHKLREGQYILPGFIDLHVHAPQWAQAGTALDIPLYDWLNTYTFPIESKFSDVEFAKKVYTDVVGTLLANGTTTALYFATIHKEASFQLAKICSEKGQRGLIGKVVMDNPDQTEAYYRDHDTKTALVETEDFIVAVNELATKTKQGVYPVVTPRFIPSCTDEALKGLGELAAKYDTYVQSHCSESDWEHGYVKDRFGKNDAFALHDFGLLREKTVMAHCNFLDEKDADLFAEKGTAVCHCPISNAYFANSVLPIAKLQSKGVEIGLGSDISGGFSPSLFDNVRQAVMSSRMLEDGVDTSLSVSERGVPHSRITLNDAFYFATAGGGESLDLPIGKLSENYSWDVQIIDTTIESARLPLYDVTEDLYDVFQKIMYLARPENIREVWVQGEKVHSR